jgi:hypothetical protein
VPSLLDKSMLDTCDTARFWVWVEKTDTCWNWVGRLDANGYGRMHTPAGQFMAHRISWAIEHGAADTSLYLDHICHNAACVRPAHLRPATAKQNAENLLPIRAASGYRGVYAAGKKWSAMVKHDGKVYRSGKHLTAESANEAAIAMRNELFTHNVLDR